VSGASGDKQLRHTLARSITLNMIVRDCLTPEL
jgi:hypothetical protein